MIMPESVTKDAELRLGVCNTLENKLYDKKIPFAEAFKEYIKGKTIVPEDRSAKFNKDYDYRTQEPIENVTEEEIDQMWIVLD